MDKKIYVVETISVFRHTYYIRAKEESHALDEFYYNKDKDTFKEGSQRHLEEIHTDVRELTEEQFLSEFKRNEPCFAGIPQERKFDFINEIDYDS